MLTCNPGAMLRIAAVYDGCLEHRPRAAVMRNTLLRRAPTNSRASGPSPLAQAGGRSSRRPSCPGRPARQGAPKGDTGAQGPKGDAGAGAEGRRRREGRQGRCRPDVGRRGRHQHGQHDLPRHGDPQRHERDPAAAGKVLVLVTGTFGVTCSGSCTREIGASVGGTQVPGLFAGNAGTGASNATQPGSCTSLPAPPRSDTGRSAGTPTATPYAVDARVGGRAPADADLLARSPRRSVPWAGCGSRPGT